MREILFRGKTKETGEWKYGFVAKIKNYSETEWVFVTEDEEGYWTYWAEVIPETIGQFTGLHDSTTWKELTEQERKDWTMKGHMPSEWRGREVYEGDIYTPFGSPKYEIRFINGAFCGGLLGGDDSIFSPLGWESPEYDEDLYLTNELFKIMKIIGNVHDNKELLQ